MSGAGTISSWSRRRAAVAAEAEAERDRALARERAERQAALEARSDAEVLAELDLPDPERMGAGDDFSAFLREEVPARLQRRALRALWRSDPVLACVDDLVDYGDDFRAEGIGAQIVTTAYRVGKGMLAHIDEMERQQAAAPAGDAPQEHPDGHHKEHPRSAADTGADGITLSEADAGAPATALGEREPAPEPASTHGTSAPAPDEGGPDEDAPLPRRQRMRFEFDGTA